MRGRDAPLDRKNSGILTGAGEPAQWMKVPDKLTSRGLSLISGLTWWSESTDSHKLSSYVPLPQPCAIAHTQQINVKTLSMSLITFIHM